MAIGRARAAIEQAGAWYVRTSKADRLEFVYSAPETIVTVTLMNDGAVVTSVEVKRQTLGG